jgi:hypothetical protein
VVVRFKPPVAPPSAARQIVVVRLFGVVGVEDGWFPRRDGRRRDHGPPPPPTHTATEEAVNQKPVRIFADDLHAPPWVATFEVGLPCAFIGFLAGGAAGVVRRDD